MERRSVSVIRRKRYSIFSTQRYYNDKKTQFLLPIDKVLILKGLRKDRVSLELKKILWLVNPR